MSNISTTVFPISTTTLKEDIVITEDAIISIMQSISIKAGYTLAGTSLFFFVFLISEFLKKTSKHKSPYFSIYAITLLEPVSTVSAFLLRRFIFPGVYFFEILNEFIWWFVTFSNFLAVLIFH